MDAENLIFRSFYAVTLAVTVGWLFRTSMGREHGEGFNQQTLTGKDLGRETPVIATPLYLPLALGTVLILCCLFDGPREGFGFFLSLSLDTVILLSLFYIPLLLFLPLLRRYFSARCCAAAWILPPLLFIYPATILGFGKTGFSQPLLTLSLPSRLFPFLLALWLTGFLVVFGGKVFLHLRFRRALLSPSRPVTEERILTIWQEELERTQYKRKVQLVTSPAAASPLSMGMTDKSRVVVLPDRPLTDRELMWIFRHEVRHLQRRDVDTKVFLAFAVAFCWFNPLMWLAVRKAAQDLELSCDEMVVEGMSEADRREYADLLLDTAWDGRGFTTCLSAGAEALRYRLGNVVQKRTKRTGTYLLAGMMFLCVMAFGLVAVTSGQAPLSETLLASAELADKEQTFFYKGRDYTLPPGQEGALLDYLGTLEAEQLVSTKTLNQNYDSVLDLLLFLETPEGPRIMQMSVDTLEVSPDWHSRSTYYLLRSDVDWDYLESLFFPERQS